MWTESSIPSAGWKSNSDTIRSDSQDCSLEKFNRAILNGANAIRDLKVPRDIHETDNSGLGPLLAHHEATKVLVQSDECSVLRE